MDVKLILMLQGILMVVSQIQARPSLTVTADVMAVERPRIKIEMDDVLHNPSSGPVLSSPHQFSNIVHLLSSSPVSSPKGPKASLDVSNVKVYPDDIRGLLNNDYLSDHTLVAFLSTVHQSSTHGFATDSLLLALKLIYKESITHTIRWLARMGKVEKSKIRQSQCVLFRVNCDSSTPPLSMKNSNINSLSHLGLIFLNSENRDHGNVSLWDSL